MRIVLFICAVLGILGGFVESGQAKTVFQQIAAGQMILGGFVCLCAAAVIEVLSNNIKQTAQVVVGLEAIRDSLDAQVVVGLEAIRDSLEKTNEALGRIAVLAQIANEKADAALFRHEKLLAKSDEISERTNQLLEWLGTVQQKSRGTSAG